MDPITFEDFTDPDEHILKVNRARLKVGGHAHRPWLKYYFEYELASSDLLDFRVMVEKYRYLKFGVGQWKVQYNRERVISSGKQQMLERSHINSPSSFPVPISSTTTRGQVCSPWPPLPNRVHTPGFPRQVVDSCRASRTGLPDNIA